ncbi:MAG: ATP-binding protein [Thermodesulfobacteriota bacterium]
MNPPVFHKLVSAVGINYEGMNPFSLRFSGEYAGLEGPFLDAYDRAALTHVRIAGFLAFLVYASFGLTDVTWAPEHYKDLWVIRYLVICPVLLAVPLFSYTRYFRPSYIQACIMALVLLGGLGIIAMMVVLRPKVYSLGLTLVLVLNFTSVRARFAWATATAWILYVVYNLAELVFSISSFELLVVADFFGASLIIIGMFACYFMEYHTRRSFLLAHALTQEKQNIREINQGLERIVEERTADLSDANRELSKKIAELSHAQEERSKLESEVRLSQRMRTVGTMASGIAHDFNNIFAIIMGNAELCSLDLPPGSEHAQMTENVLAACRRGRDLVSQFLTISSFATESARPLWLDREVREAMRLLAPSIPPRIDRRLFISEGLPGVMGVAGQMQQVLVNLCNNAVQAMGDGQGILTVSLREEAVGKESDLLPKGIAPGRYLCLTVTDTGEGMSSEVMERIFEPYFTTRETGQGSGLGLSMVHGIVKRHNGAVMVQSRPGGGSTFRVYLPACDAVPEMARLPEAKRVKRREGPVTVLLVDDEPLVADATDRLLTALGYRVIQAVDPREALRMFTERPESFDVVVTDYAMPDLNGEELARAMRSADPEVPIILCTGFARVMDAQRLQALGLQGIVTKPCLISVMDAAIQNALDSLERPEAEEE